MWAGRATGAITPGMRRTGREEKKHKEVKRKESCRTVQSDPCVLLFAAKTSELKRNTSVFDNICLEREFCNLKASFLIKEMT